jgi:hypothetical protein
LCKQLVSSVRSTEASSRPFSDTDSLQIFELVAKHNEEFMVHVNREVCLSNLPRDLLLHVTTGQRHIGDRELAISTGFITESDAGVLTHAGQAHAFFIAERTLVIIKVCMTLDNCEKGEKVYQNGENRPYQRPAGMSTGKLKVAWNHTATYEGVSKTLETVLLAHTQRCNLSAVVRARR